MTSLLGFLRFFSALGPFSLQLLAPTAFATKKLVLSMRMENENVLRRQVAPCAAVYKSVQITGGSPRLLLHRRVQ